MLNEATYKHIANAYVDIYGQKLHEEREILASQYPQVSLPEARMEKRVMEAVKTKQRKPYLFGTIGLLAACFAAALIYLIPMQQAQEAGMSTGAGGQYDMAAVMPEDSMPAATTEDSMSASADEELSVAQDDSQLRSQSDSDSAVAGEAPMNVMPEYEIIPLSVELPEGFEQTGFEQDRGKSIYYIRDELLDDVVITLERVDEFPDTEGMEIIALSNLTAYGTQTSTYCLLMFEIDDILYTLTSEHDINTLIRLGLAFATGA